MKKTGIKKGKIAKVMGEFKRGSLKSSSGNIVKDTKQAMAIAFAKSNMNKKKKK